MPDSLPQYLETLPETRRARFESLVAAVSSRVEAAPRIHAFLFLPQRQHSHFEDADDAFWETVEQLMLAEPAGTDELPLAWVGYHVANRFTNRRQAQGFLVTDRRLLVQDQLSGLFGASLPRQHPLFIGPAGAAASAAEIVGSATASYDWEFAGPLVDEAAAQHLATALAEILTAVLESLGRAGEAQEAPAAPKAADLHGRLRDLNLAAPAKSPDDPKHAKHFAKLAKKMPLDPGERILVAFTDATLMGVYGLVLTDRGVRSRDLGEAPVSTPRDRIDPAAVRVDPENAQRLLLGAGEAHELPASLDEKRVRALAALISEWAMGDISDS
ncbi:hypothetical protein D3248_11940 [Leucobacter zeae]|nr:hypothetical protein [Leucobacter zeae]